MLYQTHTLTNGIRLLYVPAESPVVYCGFVVNAGTRDELADEHGVAHFVEHMLFKGTECRKSWQVISRLESVGGQIDAFTTKEETYIYTTIPARHLERAMELLADIVFHSTFPEHELEHERSVVLEEIQSYNDSPAELIYDEFDNLLFGNTALGHSILGTEQTLQHITSAHLKRFVRRCYTTDNIVFFLLGNVRNDKLLHLAERYFGVPATQRTFQRVPPAMYVPGLQRCHKDTCQTHCMIGNRAYHQLHEDRFALLLLNNILGGPNMSSRLNMSVRERHGWAYTVESTLTLYVDTGVWSVYVGCDNSRERDCIRLIDKELCELSSRCVSPRALAKAKCQLEGQMLIADENRENLILALAKAYLQTGHCLSNAELHEALQAVTADKLRQVAADIFAEQQRSTLIFN
ncbi:MAG: M16 family metallopeptidase [Paludibacteraceae bacterium]